MDEGEEQVYLLLPIWLFRIQRGIAGGLPFPGIMWFLENKNAKCKCEVVEPRLQAR